ncbi:hypothetical protein E2C01_046846 [Portunus trituberculatus]|uniref:Uncharacterized protein n=1 Tax=Portunus trituberculatus TaxID=210409 RepID=A0A5B7G8V7_PORTR|nr:hypothetical protein [Portunus trituberculatus]
METRRTSKTTSLEPSVITLLALLLGFLLSRRFSFNVLFWEAKERYAVFGDSGIRSVKKNRRAAGCTVIQFRNGKSKLTDESDQIPRNWSIHLADQLGLVVRGSSKPLSHNDAGVRTWLRRRAFTTCEAVEEVHGFLLNTLIFASTSHHNTKQTPNIRATRETSIDTRTPQDPIPLASSPESRYCLKIDSEGSLSPSL